MQAPFHHQLGLPLAHQRDSSCGRAVAVRHVLDGRAAKAVKALADLPSLDELRAKIIGLVQAPATKIARILKEPGAKLARVVQAKSAQEAKSA